MSLKEFPYNDPFGVNKEFKPMDETAKQIEALIDQKIAELESKHKQWLDLKAVIVDIGRGAK